MKDCISAENIRVDVFCQESGIRTRKTNKRGGGGIPDKSKIKPACYRSSGNRAAKLPPSPFQPGLSPCSGSRPCECPLPHGAPVGARRDGTAGAARTAGPAFTPFPGFAPFLGFAPFSGFALFPGCIYTTLNPALACPARRPAAPHGRRPGLPSTAKGFAERRGGGGGLILLGA